MRLGYAALLLAASLNAQDPFEIHGYVQGRFTDQEGTRDRLEIRRARVLLFGDPLPQLSYAVQVDVLKKPILMDASLTWKPRREVHLTAGQFKIPFSAESLQADNLGTPIERARAVNSLTPGRDTGVQARDLGVQLSGEFDRNGRAFVEYAAGVFRGQPLVNSPTAHYRATAGRVVIHPLKGWSAGGDWYGSFSDAGAAPKRRAELEGSYQSGAWTFRIEQIWARDGKLKRSGGYGLAAWRVTRKWELLSRGEWYSPDTSKPKVFFQVYEAGANYFLNKHVKVQVNGGARHDDSPSRITGVVLVQTQLSF